MFTLLLLPAPSPERIAEFYLDWCRMPFELWQLSLARLVETDEEETPRSS